MRTDACKMTGPARRRLTGLLVGACLLVGPVAGLPGSVDASAFSAAPVATLSNLKTLTRWAYPQEPAVAHRSPPARSRVVGPLRFLTSQGQPEVYLALRSYTADAKTWIEVPLPGRPNGLTGWVAAAALGEMHITREYLRVD